MPLAKNLLSTVLLTNNVLYNITCLPTRSAGKRNPVEPASTWNLWHCVSATTLAIFVICRPDKISHVLQEHSSWEQHTMCQSIPCHEKLNTNNTGSCTTMAGEDTEMWEAENRKGTRRKKMMMMMMMMMMQTFLRYLMCACPSKQDSWFVSEVTARLPSRLVCPQCSKMAFNTWFVSEVIHVLKQRVQFVAILLSMYLRYRYTYWPPVIKTLHSSPSDLFKATLFNWALHKYRCH